MRQVDIMKSVKHQNVIEVVDVFETANKLFIVLEVIIMRIKPIE